MTRCLYVGVTANVPRRLREHSRKPWGGEVTETRTTEFPTGRDALHLEARLIARHRPPHNRLGNPDFYMGLPFADSA